MVGEDYWTWGDTGWALPGIPGIPLQNFLGWLLAAVVLMALLSRLPRKVAHDGVPTMLLIWTYASNVLAALVFFGRPGVAIWGGKVFVGTPGQSDAMAVVAVTITPEMVGKTIGVATRWGWVGPCVNTDVTKPEVWKTYDPVFDPANKDKIKSRKANEKNPGIVLSWEQNG